MVKTYGYEIGSGESFPEIDNPALTKDGEFDGVIDKIGLTPVKDINQGQKGIIIDALM